MHARRSLAIVLGVGTAAAHLCAGLAFAADADSAYTIANYPVDATAANAVAAKQQALADGQQAAFRSLLKRIVPVTAYKQLTRVKDIKAAKHILGVTVRWEKTLRPIISRASISRFRPTPSAPSCRVKAIRR